MNFSMTRLVFRSNRLASYGQSSCVVDYYSARYTLGLQSAPVHVFSVEMRLRTALWLIDPYFVLAFPVPWMWYYRNPLLLLSSCFPFVSSGQNHLARHSERGKKTRQTEEELGRQYQEMDRPGVRQVPEGSGEQTKMEETGSEQQSESDRDDYSHPPSSTYFWKES